MEIRSGVDNSRMDDTDSSSTAKKHLSEELSRPLSPCESEISVGCENESGEHAEASPMDMTEEDDGVETGGASPASTPSRSGSRNIASPQSLSPASVQDGSESFTYLSEDEYFRPLKRLAMSDSSPHHPPSGGRDHLSESMSSPEPSNPHPQQNTAENAKSQQPTRPKQSQDVNNRIRPKDDRRTDEPEREAEGGRDRGNAVADQKISGLRSFSILDILSYKPSRRKSSIPVKIVRPWDTKDDPSPDSTPAAKSVSHEQPNNNINNANNNNNNNNSNNNKKQSGQSNDRGSALDALFKMTNKTLDNLNKEDKADAVNLFNNRAPSKKKRKSRTAFTNHQIFELEKRFLYQKYLSPADRDELAQNLGLSNAQVITWFQNRRAKLKRDMEELKRDVESSKVIHSKSLLEAASANVVAFLKAKEIPKIHLAALPH